ncbi:hypothetical protein BDR22DRAFT_801862 [Usnea florida]
MAAKEWDSDRDYHESLVSSGHSSDPANRKLNVHKEEIRTTPLFSADVLACVNATQSDSDLLPQYGFLAKVLDTFGGREQQCTDDLSAPKSDNSDSRLFLNMNAPWSAFICGSQGSGKSHTLSCILEAALQPSKLGKLPYPLAGMIFHYDKFTGFSSTQVCEAAYLCSTGIPVTVLVSPSNFHRMKGAYRNIRGMPSNAPKPVVAPLLLEERHLNVERMMKLMAVDEKEGKISLYMESVCRILRSMAMKNQHTSGLNYNEFKDRLSMERFNEGQIAMLATRLQLLESFMVQPGAQVNDAKPRGIWSFKPGSLTIVDLSCPFVDESAACVMFNICLALFLEDREKAGRIVALDEAHKFMTGTDSINNANPEKSLLSVIRQQRHLATRVIIATQQPTISPSLLDLCSMTIVHRFTSRAWLTALQSHLAAVSSEGESSKQGVQDVFKQIVELEAGQGLIFSPSAMLGVDDNRKTRMLKLGIQYIKVLIRQRRTADGGRSILAT